MCEYVKDDICEITASQCPYIYWCNKINGWKANTAMPSNCKIKLNIEVPKGYYRVREERKGYLYVDIDNQSIKIKNPFIDIPLYVKVSKTKNGEYRIKK